MKSKHITQYAVPTLLSALTIFCFGATGEICGPLFETTADAFEAKFPENKSDDLKSVTSKLDTEKKYQIQNSSGQPLLIFTTSTPKSAVVAYDLKKKKTAWQVQIPINSPVTLSGNTCIVQTGYAIAAYNAGTGAMMWSIPVEEGWTYYGADANNDTVVLSLGIGSSNDGAYANGKLIALNLADGKERWQNITGNGLLGNPAVEDTFVFVPWKKKQIAILNLNTGEEVSRLRADDFTVNFVEATPHGVFYGTNATEQHVAALFKLDKHSINGTRTSSNKFLPLAGAAPNQPGFHIDTFTKPAIELANSNRIQYYWLPGPGKGRVQMAANTYYLHYWRYIFAFDAHSHQVKWTFLSREDIHSLQAVENGLFAVTVSGNVHYADANNGHVDWILNTGIEPTSVVFDVQGFRPTFEPNSDMPDPRTDLKQIIRDKDSRMLPARIYATKLLARSKAPGITGDLLELHADASMPTALQKTIVEKLAERESGAEALISSLSVRYDYLEQIAAPPMNVIAPALANMQAKEALPGLMQQILDYETPTKNIEPIATAIKQLGDATVVEPLMAFIIRYHADSSFVGYEDALTRISEVILKFGADNHKKEIEAIRDNGQTLPEYKKQLLTILDPDADKKAMALAIKKAQEAEIARQRAVELKAAQELANRPYYLSRDDISSTISQHAYLLRPCIKSALENRLGLRQVRMKFAITGETGKAAGLQILPADIPGLQECLAEGLSQIEFPKFKNVRQSASHTIRITGVRRQRSTQQ
ncbi:MAG: PQQ-binding-like beta-propeller repeat protein [Deltaproteobacteria bacterium]|nr:PQQ-binding-like beta-propeller repeat protein [Deltaproteobacteria bacterium]